MKNIRLVRHKQQIDALFKKVKDLGYDAEMQSHWSRYLCVLVSGFVEQSVRAVLSEFAENKSDPRVSNFVERRLGQFQNGSMGKILDLLGSFSGEWHDSLESATVGELKAAVDSVVANRHLIAHGRSVGITFVTMSKYYQNVVKMIELLEEQCSD